MAAPRQRLQLPSFSLNQFSIGDLVWARNRSSDPFWPVRLASERDESQP